MKTEELIRALAMDSTLPRASPHADGPPRSKKSRSPNRDPAFQNNFASSRLSGLEFESCYQRTRAHGVLGIGGAT